MQDDPPEDVEDEFGTVSAKDSRSVLPGDASGIFEDEVNLTDVGSVSREAGGPFGIDYAKMTFWEFLFGVDDVKAWDVDLGEFLNEVEEDPDAATMLGAANEFDPDAEDSLEDEPEESQSESCDIDENDVLFQGIEDSPSKGILNEAINELISLGFYGFILIVICAIFLICMFLGYG